MKYIVIEIQKLADGTIAVPPISTYDTFLEAMAKYHQVMSVAAASAVPVHSCVVLTDVGQEIKMDSYNKNEPTEEE